MTGNGRAGGRAAGAGAAAMAGGTAVVVDSSTGGGATARSSSRTSMPTGHQVMHRPQPTQPDIPNWSHHVPNLWVSHCR